MKFKKILSLLTAAAMTLSLGITSVSADTTEEAGSVVAKIGETGYTSLADAFNAAANKATITVVADTSIIGDAVSFNGKSVTLDLNGKTITAENKVSGYIVLTDNASLTLKDTVGGGSIVSNTKFDGTADTTKPVINVDGGSTFTMQSGTIETVYGTTAKDAENYGQYGVGVWKNSSATINGGTIKSGWYCVASNGSKDETGAYVGDKANITVNGGKLISTADYAIYAPSVNGTVTIAGGEVVGATGAVAMRAGDLIVNGGTLGTDKTSSTGTWADGTGNIGNAVIALASGSKTAYGSINARIHGGEIKLLNGAEDPLFIINKGDKDLKFTIDGGTFSEDISTTYKDYLDSKATVAKNADNLYEVTVPKAVRMDSKDYPSIQAAVDVIKPTSTSRYIISLRRDVNTPTVIKNRQHITIKLEGHNITASGYNGVFYVENSEVIFKNKTTGDTTEGGVVTAVEDQSRTMGIWASTGAKVTLRELTYKQQISNHEDDHFDLIYANKDARVYVESGTFESATPKWTLNKYDTDSATITVTGGKFYNYNPAASYTEPTQPTSFVKDGYSVTTDGDYFVVSQKPVAVNVETNKEYFSLDDAVKAVAAGEKATIKLLENVSSRTIISGKKDITLDLNGKTVSAYAGKDGVFVVNDGATLTIEGEGNVVARQYMTAIAIDVAANATVNIKGGNFSQKVDTPDESGHYDFIYIEGAGANVNISGGTFTAFTPKWTLNIKDEYASMSKFNVTGGTFYQYNPAASDTEPNGPVSFVADEYVATADKSGNYTVEARAEDFGTVAVMTHGKGKLTLLSGINFLDYRNAGFIVKFDDGTNATVDTTVVYDAVSDASQTKSAAEFGNAKYIFGANLDISEMEGKINSFTITPFANVLNKSEQIKAAAATKVNISNTDATVSE